MGNFFFSLLDGEQTVTKWEDDRAVKTCPYCENSFTLINRKHHCRLCGKIVCGNARCSKMIPLFTDMSSGINSYRTVYI